LRPTALHHCAALHDLSRQVGDAEARRQSSDGVNPYAHLLSPEKIEALEVTLHTLW
jgi:hypothetical protein